MLCPTPPEKMCDPQGRPYFLWDVDVTLEEFRERLADPDPKERAYWIAKLMRQGKPDDVYTFVSTGQIRELWEHIEPFLGREREMWRWLLEELGKRGK